MSYLSSGKEVDKFSHTDFYLLKKNIFARTKMRE